MVVALVSPHIETFWTPELARGYPAYLAQRLHLRLD